ncbi:oligopeptide transporter [Planoprotostelium fungivorum]|uniref:Oligopeptide transporter n=1 Tax=Planoprotostelium fungivorum TaxID=1890364 RepID=A0A2P6NH63_9EUKA|nr:oligopeptide transporter [Planoprotostelium fungivorum]
MLVLSGRCHSSCVNNSRKIRKYASCPFTTHSPKPLFFIAPERIISRQNAAKTAQSNEQASQPPRPLSQLPADAPERPKRPDRPPPSAPLPVTTPSSIKSRSLTNESIPIIVDYNLTRHIRAELFNASNNLLSRSLDGSKSSTIGGRTTARPVLPPRGFRWGGAAGSTEDKPQEAETISPPPATPASTPRAPTAAPTTTSSTTIPSTTTPSTTSQPQTTSPAPTPVSTLRNNREISSKTGFDMSQLLLRVEKKDFNSWTDNVDRQNDIREEQQRTDVEKSEKNPRIIERRVSSKLMVRTRSADDLKPDIILEDSPTTPEKSNENSMKNLGSSNVNSNLAELRKLQNEIPPVHVRVNYDEETCDYWRAKYRELIVATQQREGLLEEKILALQREKAMLISKLTSAQQPPNSPSLQSTTSPTTGRKAALSLSTTIPLTTSTGTLSPPASSVSNLSPHLLARLSAGTNAIRSVKSLPPPTNETPEEKKLRYYKETVKEILRTENEYVSDLIVLHEVYLYPLKMKSGRILNANDSDAFDQLTLKTTDLLGVNTEFLTELNTLDDDIQEGKRDYKDIGKVFLKYAEFFKIYATYCAYQDGFKTGVYDKSVSKNKQLSSFLETARQDPRCRRLGLLDFLIMPMQRICRYPLLLRELVNYAKECQLTHDDISTAFNKISDVVNIVNERKGQIEVVEKTRIVCDGIEAVEGEALVNPSRMLVKDGIVQRTVADGKIEEVTGEVESSANFLTQKVLAKAQRKNSWVYRCRMDILDVQFRELSNSSFMLVCTTNNKKETLTTDDKEQWQQSIVECMTKIQKDIKGSFMSESQLKRFAEFTTYEGTLNKLSAGSWKTRHFSLKEGVMYRSKAKTKGGKSKGQLQLTSSTVIEEYHGGEEQFAFIVKPEKGKNWILRAEDEFSMHEWLNVLYKHKLLGDGRVEAVVQLPQKSNFPSLHTANSQFNTIPRQNITSPSGTMVNSVLNEERTPLLPQETKTSVNDELPEPTEEEKKTLRRVSDAMPVAAFLIVLVEFCERFAFFGLTGPWVNYVQWPLPPGSNTGAPHDTENGQPGALGRGQQMSTALNQFFTLWCYLTPVLGAIIADTKWGKFKTIAVSAGLYLFGILVLLFTAIPPVLTKGDVPLYGLIASMTIIGVAAGGIKSNVSTLVAEQYTNTKQRVKTLPSGEKVIIDPGVTIQRIFNWFYLMINVGGLASIATTSAERYVGYWLSYTIPAALFFGVPLVLIIGYSRYVKTPPRGSVLLEAFRVWKIVFSWNPRTWFSGEDRYELAKPSFITNGPQNRPLWLTWDDAFVDELKRTVAACRVFLFFPIYWLAFGQITANLVSQAATMETHHIPNDVLNNFDPITVILLIPIMDTFVYPGLRRCGIRFPPMARIFVGFILSAVAIAYAAGLQWYIYKFSECGQYASECKPAPISVWVQVPAYVLMAMSEIFASITGLEYAFNKAPARLKSLVMSMFLLTSAVGSALNLALVPVSKDPYLVWMYVGVGSAALVFGVIFYIVFYKRDAHEEEENSIGKDR